MNTEQINRAISILKSPLTELTKVKSEGINKNDIIKRYIAILALIPAIAYIIGKGIVGVDLGFESFKYPIETAVVGGILTYMLDIVNVYVIGIVITALAPSFASKQDENHAMKLAAYSATAGWRNIQHHTVAGRNCFTVCTVRIVYSLSWHSRAHGNAQR